MIMRRFYSLFILVLFVSCEQFLEVELPDQDQKLVINALLEPADTLKVFLTKSKSVLDSESQNDKFESVKTANVTLSSAGMTLPFTYIEKPSPFGTEAYYYLPNPNLKDSESYKITAESAGFQSAQGTVVLPESVPVKDISYKNLGQSSDLEAYDEVEITVKFEDPAGKNFYQINGEYFGISTERANFFYVGSLNPDPVNPIYRRNDWFDSGLLFNDLLLNGKDSEMVFRVTLPRNAALKVTIHLRHVSESLYLYDETASLQNQTRDDFFSQPVLVYSNVENGLGIIKARNSDTKVLEMAFLD